MNLRDRFPARDKAHQKALDEYLKTHTPPPMSNQALISCAIIAAIVAALAFTVFLCTK